MTQQHWGNSGSKIYLDWHEFRANARRTAFSKEEFSPIEQEQYDLDTAGINGEANPETYITEPFGPANSTDRRDDNLMD